MTSCTAANILRFAKDAFQKDDINLTIRLIKDLPKGVFSEACIRGAVALDKDWSSLSFEVKQALIDAECLEQARSVEKGVNNDCIGCN